MANLGDIGDLHQAVLALDDQLRHEMHDRWQRDLPFEELLFDRWERAKNLGFGDGTSIYHNSYVYGDVRVGDHTWIGPFTLLDGSGSLTIGDHCSISAGVHIYTHDTVKWALSGGKADYERAPVEIGNCCFIGSQAVITKGVVIGDHCLIGACSLVDQNLPHYTIGVGIPCRTVGRVQIGEKGEVSLVFERRAQAP